ncbi:AAA family ATPase [Hymenobacter arizonensis]|uniref:5-methylcytosine-specific restriction enzyme B n=1 Tax=Hymenobacter arizonensis TaxID=1227077 RepID=A0A1I5XQ64_HYMAR|nr:AAA family ATPase [Hymenobacter arizonensis]SFQ34092.1 5-methylcytosine-specific restriction enzyme B [Hymenobacter arizonensis]
MPPAPPHSAAPSSAQPSPAPLLTREQVLRALRQIAREGRPLPAGTVYELVYRGRRYPPRAVAELAYRLATGNPAAHWPRPAGGPTNTVLEGLDFTISTKRPVLTSGSAHDGDETARQQAESLYTGLVREASDSSRADTVAEPPAAYEATPYTRADAATELFITEGELEAALAGLARRRNLLLQGPPGTGKTFLARRLAWLLLEAKDESRIELVQFHPSYGYEDFMLGFRPDAEGRFHLVPGVLPLLCQRAAADPSRPYFLLIDEVNRGNVSRIFGELLLLLEADKRGPAHALRLPYAPPDAPRFFVPDNLYVIGTLNLADRSLSPLDYALRRRFAFVELKPQFGAPLQQFLAARQVPAAVIEQLCTRMAALNQTIADDPELGPDFQIGHSYFCQPPPQPAQAAEWLRLIFEQEIGPLLADYWREQPATAATQLRKLLA